MKITNKLNLPAPIYDAINTPYRKKDKRLSITDILKPIQAVVLERQHWDELEEDCSDRIWMLLGTLLHGVLEGQETENVLIEEKLEFAIPGTDWLAVGKVDLLEPYGAGYQITDYKFSTLWAFKEGVKHEHTEQINLYAALYRAAGFDIRRGRIVAVYRDWSKPRSRRERDYPKRGVEEFEVPLWSEKKAETYLKAKAGAVITAIESGAFPECSPEERWNEGDKYACIKPGGKRAQRVFSSRNEAAAFVNDHPKLSIEVRPGEDKRCADYCSVRDFCSQFRMAR